MGDIVQGPWPKGKIDAVGQGHAIGYGTHLEEDNVNDCED